jgi:Fe2+ transport system protein B
LPLKGALKHIIGVAIQQAVKNITLPKNIKAGIIQDVFAGQVAIVAFLNLIGIIFPSLRYERKKRASKCWPFLFT